MNDILIKRLAQKRNVRRKKDDFDIRKRICKLDFDEIQTYMMNKKVIN